MLSFLESDRYWGMCERDWVASGSSGSSLNVRACVCLCALPVMSPLY
jgi:hypothetical protein